MANPDPPNPWASKYRGATVEDLDPPTALSTTPSTPIHVALLTALERDFTHLTVLDPVHKTLLGYLSVPTLRAKLDNRSVTEMDVVERAMTGFRRRGRVYRVICPETPLEELEGFFEGEGVAGGERQEFAVVTDGARRFVLGVVTRADLEEFVRRRP